MQIRVLEGFSDYDLIDSGDGMRLERYGAFTIARPDPQAIWKRKAPQHRWDQADAMFDNSLIKGHWNTKVSIPEHWTLKYKDLSFYARLTPFKHTGIFPEQAVMWDWMDGLIRKAGRPIRVLNLFGYTGIASLVATQAGAKVTHLDASKPSLTWARENMLASHLPEDSIRWILDDAMKFTKREITRGSYYDGILMDPPVYGHGPKGEAWDFNKQVAQLFDQCRQILTPQPLFFLVNAYAVSASAIMLGNCLTDLMEQYKGKVEYGELALRESIGKRLLSTGIYARWEETC